jgi:STE24 endopeptidase
MTQWNVASICFIVVFVIPLLASLWLEWLNRRHVRKTGDAVPGEFQGFLTDDGVRRSNAYTIEKSRFSSVAKLFSDMIVLAVVCSALLPQLAEFSARLGRGYVSEGLIFFALLGAGFFAVETPWRWYATFVIEGKFGFNRSTVGTWVLDLGKEAVVSLVLLVAFMGPVLWLIQACPGSWWVTAFVVVSVLQLVIVIVYPVMIAPLFNTFEPLQDRSLAQNVEAMTRRVGLTPRGIFQMDAGRRSAHSNAYFTGLGKTKRVVLFDTLLQSHCHDEILGVLAHELGHFKLKHVIKSYLLSEAVLLAGFFLTYLLMNWNVLYDAVGVAQSQSYVCLFLIGVFLQRAGFFMGPSFTALSRRFERDADAFAVWLQGDAEPLATALKKLMADNMANLNPHPLYAWFFSSHPPVLERVRILEGRSESRTGSQSGSRVEKYALSGRRTG